MPWEETDEYIRSGHRDPSEFQPDSFRTIDIDAEKGIKAIIAKPKGSDKTEIQSYLFSKEKGWTLDKAKDWFSKHANEVNHILFESATSRENRKIKGVAAYAGKSRNNNLYLPEELSKADNKVVPIYWEHDPSKVLGKAVFKWNPELELLEYEGELFNGVDASHVSIAANYDYYELFHNIVVPRGLDFIELSLTNNPGFPLTSVVAESLHPATVENVTVTQTASVNAEAGVAPQHHTAEEKRGEMVAETQDSPKQPTPNPPVSEAEWDTEYINNLPDAAFAVILPGGEKDEEGKTKPRSLRKLPHHNSAVKDPDEDTSVDLPHLRNALARLPQTDMPEEYREKARKHLEAHAERLGVGKAAQQEKKECEKMEENKNIKAATEETPTPKISESRYATIFKALRRVAETIDSSSAANALGQIWQPDMITLPAGLAAGLRKFAEVVEIPQGADRVHFTRITTPSFASLTEGTAPSDVSQTIDKVSVQPAERGAKQTITYTAIESSTPDLVEAVERAFQAAAVLDEDGVILAQLDAASGIAATIYGGNATTEAEIDAADKIAAANILQAVKEILEEGFPVNPGDLVCVLSPKQYNDLLQDTSVQNAFQYGSLGGGLSEGVVGRLYGVDIVVSTKVPTGSGSGSPPLTTYHAFVFKKTEAVGLGISRNLLLETDRKIDERKIVLMATHRIAAAVKVPKAVVKIITA